MNICIANKVVGTLATMSPGRGLVACAVLCLSTTPAVAASPAGVRITNVARLAVADPRGDRSIVSNQVQLTVDEVLDLVLTAGPSRPAPVTAFAFTLTNTGNGAEAFDLAASGDSAIPVRGFAIDVDGDGRFDPARDRLLPGGRTASLASGASVSLLTLLDAGDAAASTLRIVARCVTGSGRPGTVLAGQGDGDTDAVIGATGGMAELALSFDGTVAAPTLVKTQAVRAPDGSSRPAAGAIVTYTLEARFAGPTDAARIVDPIPTGTVYVAGSLLLDAASLSDAADGDAGTGGAAGIEVALGDVPRAATHIVEFKVRIQ